MKHHDPQKRAKALEKLNTLKRVNVTDAALILGLHYVTVADYIAQGKLDAFLIGRRFYVTHTEMYRYMEFGPNDKKGNSDA